MFRCLLLLTDRDTDLRKASLSLENTLIMYLICCTTCLGHHGTIRSLYLMSTFRIDLLRSKYVGMYRRHGRRRTTKFGPTFAQGATLDRGQRPAEALKIIVFHGDDFRLITFS